MSNPKRALISVSDKTGIAALGQTLQNMGFEIISTGGTAAILRDAGVTVTSVQEITGFPEIMDGRVKTLHPKIHGGLLGRGDQDLAAMQEHGIQEIDILVVNLYPFEETIARPDCSREEAVENIDIGGPAMIRAAAKNHDRVTVLVEPEDYGLVLAELGTGGKVSTETRRYLASRAFAHTACYDAAVWAYLHTGQTEDTLPPRYPLGMHRIEDLRYGENPHQAAALYAAQASCGGTLVGANQLQGKPLSYNNLSDADAALECVKTLPGNGCVIVKHANPCGVAMADDAESAYRKAYATDPASAFGGIIAFNLALSPAAAEAIIDNQFVEVIVAPRIEPPALEILSRKPNVRVLETGIWPENTHPGLTLYPIGGGILVQEKDVLVADPASFKVVTQRKPDEQEVADAMLAWSVVRFVKSNAIVFGRDGATLGIGAGQTSRVMSVEIAGQKANAADLDLEDAAMASDAFFPFRDGIDIAAGFGIRVIIQPGGSVRDEEVIAAANEHGMAMLFTGTRHFRH